MIVLSAVEPADPASPETSSAAEPSATADPSLACTPYEFGRKVTPFASKATSLPEIAEYFGSSAVPSSIVTPLRSAFITLRRASASSTPISITAITSPPSFGVVYMTVAGAYTVSATPLTLAASFT